MAAISVTAANVAVYDGATTKSATCGSAAIAAGKAVYKDSGDSLLKLSRANAAGTAHCSGVAINSGSSGQPVDYVTAGDYNPGVVVTLGDLLVVGPSAAGDIAPYGDLGSGDFSVSIGYAVTTSKIRIRINEAGVAKA